MNIDIFTRSMATHAWLSLQRAARQVLLKPAVRVEWNALLTRGDHARSDALSADSSCSCICWATPARPPLSRPHVVLKPRTLRTASGLDARRQDAV